MKTVPVGTKTINLSNDVAYYRIKLANSRWSRLHRYIMESHLKRGLASYEVVHHIDGDSLNNDLSNLQIMTSGQHIGIHNRDKNHTGGKNPNVKLTEENVRQIRKLLKETSLTQREIGNMFGVCTMTISHIKTKKRWSFQVE